MKYFILKDGALKLSGQSLDELILPAKRSEIEEVSRFSFYKIRSIENVKVISDKLVEGFNFVKKKALDVKDVLFKK